MATTLLRNLIFDVHGSGACRNHLLDGAGDIERATPAGIDVDQQRSFNLVGDATHVGQHIIERGHAEIRQAIGIIGDASAGQQVELHLAGRLQLLLQEYGHFAADPEGFCKLLDGLVALRGRDTVEHWQALARSGRWAEAFAAMMQAHYDPLYERSFGSSYRQLPQATTVMLTDAEPGTLQEAARRLMG